MQHSKIHGTVADTSANGMHEWQLNIQSMSPVAIHVLFNKDPGMGLKESKCQPTTYGKSLQQSCRTVLKSITTNCSVHKAHQNKSSNTQSWPDET